MVVKCALSAPVAPILAAVATVIAPVIAPIVAAPDAFADDGRRADDGRGSRDRCPDHTWAANTSSR